MSTILILCTQVAAFPQSSIAVQVREIVDAWGHVPGVMLSRWVIKGFGSQMSVTLAFPVLDGADESLHSILASAGHVMAEGVVS